MRRASIAFAGLAALFLGQALAQQSAPPAASKDFDRAAPLTLRTRIPLPGVYGRMDHYGWDSKRATLIVAALGNNTVEIVDSWKRVRTITGLEHPQAAVYVPGLDRIVVSSQSGKLRFYDAETYALLDTLDFGANADTDTCATMRPRSAFMWATDAAPMERSRSWIRRAWSGCGNSSWAATPNHSSWRTAGRGFL
jgi:hypothetical protein